MSAYPPLNNYIKGILLESLSLMNENNLERFELRLHIDQEVQEKFLVDINYELIKLSIDELTNEFRNCIHSLETRCKSFKKVSEDCLFKILLHTKSYDFSNETKSEDFLWVRDNVPPRANDDIEIIPISMKPGSVQLYVEKYNKEC